MKISVISPVKNEIDFAGYSIMAVLPYVHEILYGVADSDDGTLELLGHIRRKYAHEKLRIFGNVPGVPKVWDFDPLDLRAYNAAYNALIEQATGDAVWFLHPDMIVTNPEQIARIDYGNLAALAWWTNIASFARDVTTEITSGRTSRWKNIHRKEFGLHYFGGYGSQNEDFYFRDITGDTYRHHGDDFALYPFEVADSGIQVNHYCELKTYKRRFEKMVRCLKTQIPGADEKTIKELAGQHPRVTLENSSAQFGRFEFAPSKRPVPLVFQKYGAEFAGFKKELAYA